MADLTIVLLCQILSNLTRNRCNFVENSNTCRCVGDFSNQISPTVVVSTAPNIMLSEVFLIFCVLAIWLSAIGFCLNQYKSLRRLETQVHYCVNRKDPLNIGDIKIVAREQDSIIYKKKRYSTILDTHMDHEKLKAMHYVQQYLPKPPMKTIQSTVSALVISPDDLTASIPLSATTGVNSSINNPLSTHDELAEYQSSITNINTDIESNESSGQISNVYQTQGNTRHSTGLTIPHVFIPNRLHSSWNTSHIHETSRSTQHLCVPSSSLRSDRYSDGNISLPVPPIAEKTPKNSEEQLIDPRLIPETVRRSLLALHRESQENIHMLRRKHETQSENDVHGSSIPWKLKMKSKLKRTHPQLLLQQQQLRPHSNTLSILPLKYNNNNEYERRLLENVTTHNENQYSTSPSPSYSRTSPLVRRSLKNCPQFATQSTSESDTTQGEVQIITSFYVPINDDKSPETIIETTEKLL